MERVIKETTRKNSNKTAGPARVLFALAMRIFTKLAKPEKMAWMFDYRIAWTPPSPPSCRPPGHPVAT